MESWKQDIDCCSWDGVMCDNTSGDVIGLGLSCSWLNGTIPSNSFLFRLPHLQHLNLAYNYSNHSPISFGGCNFYGPIPTWLGNLTQLTLLNLSANNFAGEIPSSLSNLKALSSLDIRSNNLSGAIPMWLGNLTRVTDILFGNNSFTGQIPSSLIYLKDLNFLGLKENNIQGKIPSFFTNLTKLTSVFLSYNQLSSFGEFQFSNSLEVLALSNNKLYGSIPKSLPNLANLAYLDISSNYTDVSVSCTLLLNSIPDKRNDIYNVNIILVIVYFNIKNDLTGIVDIDMFKKLKKLETLDLHANLLHGKVPVLPSSMQNLFISNNRLSGEIPSMICNITFLTILDISNNSLSGTIPSCLGNFSNSLSNRLRTLAFNGNLLEGLLPKSFVNCINLEVLDLGNYKINDSFPYWLVALPKLQVLVLRSNKFHGPIENYETSGMFFSKLRILGLSHNEFIALTTNESEVDPKYIGENFYHGLPGEYVMENYLFLRYQDSVIIAMKCNVLPLKKILTIFAVIDLSRNMFYGKIPKVLGTLKLNGHIPSSLANLSVLESLDLSSNMLTGEIPMQLTRKQFNTFQNASYDGNLGLCEFPLSMKCSTDETPSPPPPPPPPSIFEEDNDSTFASGFGWKSVLMGYGCGLVIGMAMGYIVFKTGKPHWLVRFVEALKDVKWKDETA
ncbi:hypothetical protein RGQ29_031580 [Quercus rubra]|uniref:Leucine-rich repeat-containing N-terminal plant-type domain-containing protein n=1 Tax=Quercus rubra TaxID=3512 RepID=A0AAN7EMI1_QUERU|nr:hypothetical protein RGQ29_031580 [Quercus rubra]